MKKKQMTKALEATSVCLLELRARVEALEGGKAAGVWVVVRGSSVCGHNNSEVVGVYASQEAADSQVLEPSGKVPKGWTGGWLPTPCSGFQRGYYYTLGGAVWISIDYWPVSGPR